ncbi:MAG: hypothetical protein H0U53_01135 [Actinobacteria bacterium]|nr:hypothetical protein [Actinomycetota bacterium]
MAEVRTEDKKPHLLLVIGGVLLILGTFLSFVKVGTQSFSASDAEEGSNYLMAGVLSLITAGVLFGVGSASVRKGFAAVTLLLVGFLGLYAAIADLRSINDFGSGASVGIGVYVLLIGGLLSVVGAVLALRSPAPTTHAHPPSDPPPASDTPTEAPPAI